LCNSENITKFATLQENVSKEGVFYPFKQKIILTDGRLIRSNRLADTENTAEKFKTDHQGTG
jgi:hypothetical protein